MNIERLRRLCLSMPGATEHVQWGNDLVFKVGGRMFAVAALDADASHRVSFKCSDEQFVELQENEGVVPAPYLARAKWVALERFDALDDRTIDRSVRDAYTLVKSKLTRKQQGALDATSRPSRATPRKGSGSRARSRRSG
jgi:predicted DNA-binding protein (MmcQ/YjbR family)